MAIIECPTRNDLPAYNYVTTLDGTSYQLDFKFNERMANGVGKWMLSISDELGNPIIENVPMVATWPLFDRFKDERLPPGTLTPFDTTGNNEDPARFDLGDRVRLLYIEQNT